MEHLTTIASFTSSYFADLCGYFLRRGNYDIFEKTAAERHRNAKKAAEGQDRQKKHMQVCQLSGIPFFVASEHLLPPCSDAERVLWMRNLTHSGHDSVTKQP